MNTVKGYVDWFFVLQLWVYINNAMATRNQLCACDPCGCSVNPETAVEKEGKIYCSQPCADGHAGEEQCCSSCNCC